MSAIDPTPGPWQIHSDYTLEGRTMVIGNVDGEYIDGQAHTTFDFVCDTLGDDDSGSASIAVANARVICAVPDMIAALKAVNLDARPSNWDDDDDPKQVAAWRKLDAVLAAIGGAA